MDQNNNINKSNNNISLSPNNIRQQQVQQQLSDKLTHKLQEEQHQQQQQHQQSTAQQINENQQQFCLRWHNHQTSLLSTLPILLDQSHLTDVTISAEGRNLSAHRVVLSACSSFFLEIFRSLDSSHHPVIIIPGASFTAIVALLTFMYSGEVNVYEQQIPTLLSLAETLGIKGLADVQNNKSTKIQAEKALSDAIFKDELEKSPTPPASTTPTASTCSSFLTPPQQQQPSSHAATESNSSFSSLLNPVKFPSPLENLFLKSLQFYPNLLPQPLNFSQHALNKTSELLAKYQQHCNLYQGTFGVHQELSNEEMLNRSPDEIVNAAKRLCTGLEKKQAAAESASLQQQQQQTQKDNIRRIDKIVENLRVDTKTANEKQKTNESSSSNSSSVLIGLTSHLHNQLSPLSIKTSIENYSNTTTQSSTAAGSPHHLNAKGPMFQLPSPTCPPNSASPQTNASQLGFAISPEDQLKLQQHLDKYARTQEQLGDKMTPTALTSTKTPSNSKLYATCFICHKQLSNQYNLRVHLETHQNVRYACNVCSHVSRSKDALRKHVSYRHPGAPSPCDEARRKRAASKASAATTVNTTMANSLQVAIGGCNTPTSPNPSSAANQASMSFSQQQQVQSQLTTAQLTSAYQQMFMPNLHLAAASMAAQHHQAVNENNDNNQALKNLSLPSTATTISTSNHNNTTTTAPPVTSADTNNTTSLLPAVLDTTAIKVEAAITDSSRNSPVNIALKEDK